MKYVLAALIVFSCSAHALIYKPDPVKTPGSYCTSKDKDFVEYRYAEAIAICVRNVSSSTKSEVYAAYGIPLDERMYYTVDHKLPLFLGGSNRKDNLWPQPKVVSTTKLEGQVYNLLKEGVLTQSQSVRLILSQKQ